MGKEFFEFLEEEFQALTSQVQEALKQESLLKNDSSSLSSEIVDIPVLFTRCHAIHQQMTAESRRRTTTSTNNNASLEFRDRLVLYSIQLNALLEHYQNSKFLGTAENEVDPSSENANQGAVKSSDNRRELTFVFTIDGEEEDTNLI